MPSTRFELAPPVAVVDGLTAVPIDIQSVQATIVFDVAMRVADVDATVEFVMGDAAGCPVFDLRQDIASATLDSAAILPSQLAHHHFGNGAGAQMRIVETTLAAGSRHTLRLHYQLEAPNAVDTRAIDWHGDRLSYDFWFSDLAPGRYLEMWLPANVIFDHFRLDLDVRVAGAAIEHIPITNGEVTTLGAQHWRIVFPDHYSSCSPMLVIEATDRIASREGCMPLPDGGSLTLSTHRLRSVAADLAAVESSVASFISDNIADIGPYLQGDRFTTFLWDSPRAMQYAAGTTCNLAALQREVLYSWSTRATPPTWSSRSQPTRRYALIGGRPRPV